MDEQSVAVDDGSATTNAGSGLVIKATFDSSITQNADAAAIESAIHHAIAIDEALFGDQITVSILFRYSSTRPDGSPIGNAVGLSNSAYYIIDWRSYISALIADARTNNDKSARASLPSAPLSTNVRPSPAAGRAIGLNTPPAVFANGSVGARGPYDGVITINSSVSVKFTRPVAAGSYDGQMVIEHEIDEILGLGSFLGSSNNDLRPQDLFSWSGPNSRNLSLNGDRYFSIDRGNNKIVSFNQQPNLDTGDWLSESCPQTDVRVQNARSCPGQAADISAASPEAVNLDVVGYDLGVGAQSTVQFTAKNYSVSEGAANALVTISRRGSLKTAASVHFATVDGTAHAGFDYRARSGVLKFAPNEARKTIKVSIINDQKRERGEFFKVKLTATKTASVGNRATATVTITHNDGGNPPAGEQSAPAKPEWSADEVPQL